MKISFNKGNQTGSAPLIPDPVTGSMVVSKTGKLTGLRICFSKGSSRADYIPLPPNPDTPNPVVPITGYGDMFRAVYDVDVNGVVDRVDFVKVDEVENLQNIINDIYSQIAAGGSGGSANVIVATNNGPDNIKQGQAVAFNSGMYRVGKSIAPAHNVIGVAINDSDTGTQLWIQTSGIVFLPETSWDIVTGTVGGLGIGSSYYASALGSISNVPPSSAPEFFIPIGQSIDRTKLLIDLKSIVKL